jgi:hypothetical protein
MRLIDFDPENLLEDTIKQLNQLVNSKILTQLLC